MIMIKILLKSEQDLYQLFDTIYDMISDTNVMKAKYLNKDEQYSYQRTFVLPICYPCVMTYSLFKDNYSDYSKPYLHNKNYYEIRYAMFTYLTDFDTNLNKQ